MKAIRTMCAAAALCLASTPLWADQLDDELASAKAMLLAGRTDEASDKLDDLETAARQAVALKPGDAHANYILGMAAMYVGDDALSERALDMAVRLEPRNAAYLLGRAELDSYQGKPGEAAVLLQRFLQDNPENVDAWEHLGMAQTESRSFEAARASFQKAADLTPRDPKNLTRVAESDRALGKLDDAIAAYQKALAIDPHFAPAFAGLGETYAKQKAYDKAVASFDQAAAADPSDYRSIAREVQLDELTGNKAARDAAIKRILDLHAAKKIDTASFCREQMVHGGKTVMVFQYFADDAAKPHAIYGFVVLKDDGKTAAERLELALHQENSAARWDLTVDNAAGHGLLATDTKAEPTYEATRQWVADYLDGKLKAGSP